MGLNLLGRSRGRHYHVFYLQATQDLVKQNLRHWTASRHVLDHEYTFARTIKDLMDGIAASKSTSPLSEDGYRCKEVLDTVERSTEGRERIGPEYGGL